MILISPRGKEVEFSDEKGEKFLASKSKIRQGWKVKDELDSKQIELNKKIHKDRSEAVGDLSEYILNFSQIIFSELDEKEFQNLIEEAEDIRDELTEEVNG